MSIDMGSLRMNVIHDVLPGRPMGVAARVWRRSTHAALNWAFRGSPDRPDDSFAESGLPHMRQFRVPFSAMASACEVVLACEDEAEALTLAEAAINEVQRIEHKFSRCRGDSIVSRINAAAGLAAVECDAETLSLLAFADSVYRSSGGLFDITTGALGPGADRQTSRLPAPERPAEWRSLSGWQQVQRDGRHVRLAQPGMAIDFGSFGKAYAADRAATLMRARGAKHGYVNLAGDLRVLGPKPDGEPWMIGIQDPRRRGEVIATIPVCQGGLATRGDSERGLAQGGQPHGHRLDRGAGWPVGPWRAVSVLAPQAVVAGNCGTIALLKQADGLGYLQASGLNYLAMDQHGAIHTRLAAAA